VQNYLLYIAMLAAVAPITLGASGAKARSFSVLHAFTGDPDGANPAGSLIYIDGAFYGTTAEGGANGYGSVFKITSNGTLSIVYSFKAAPDGAGPAAGLIDVGGALYGTTAYGGSTACAGGGANPCGTVFKVTLSGAETVLHAFAGGSDGSQPEAGLIDVDGTLYGTTEYGGPAGYGTVFKMTDPDGAAELTVIHSFNYPSAYWPVASLLDVDGKLYGTTFQGGQHNLGTVFRVTRSGEFKVVYSFAGGSDGEYPAASLINVNGLLYGTTTWGGGNGCSFNAEGCGTVFTVTKAGVEKVLNSFQSVPDGAFPYAPLINDGGTLYGTTNEGGHGTYPGCRRFGCGTVFKLTTEGVETVLHSFQITDGRSPVAGLAKHGHTLYGTTNGYGADGGTVFSITR
jgi:uncharacterized repeat protein (TIGR03803 family)